MYSTVGDVVSSLLPVRVQMREAWAVYADARYPRSPRFIPKSPGPSDGFLDQIFKEKLRDVKVRVDSRDCSMN